MGWVDRKWFPSYPGDYCSGFYRAPEGVEPIWELKDPDFHGTRDHSPKWVMVNGREIPDRLIRETSGGPECEIERYGKEVPYRYTFYGYFCRIHVVFLHDDAAVLWHLKGNKSLFGQLVKAGIVQPIVQPKPKTEVSSTEVPKKEEPKVEVPASLVDELRAFLEPFIAANDKFVGLWKQGKPGPLVGAAVRMAAGKYEGKYIEKMLKEIVDGRPL